MNKVLKQILAKAHANKMDNKFSTMKEYMSKAPKPSEIVQDGAESENEDA